MTDIASKAEVDAATAYEEFFVPALFEEWAPRVAATARLRPGQRVLDVACGTGVLARAAKAAVGGTGSVAGLDPSLGMLAVAERLEPSIAWRRGTAEALPYPDGAFDAVVSQFGLMFFTDARQAIREMLRVLAPGGRLAVAVWDGLENVPAYAAEVALLQRVAGQRAADALRAPFALGDPGEVRALFAGTGVEALEITTVPGTARFPSIRAMVGADLSAWMPMVGVELSDEVVERILAEAESDLAPYVVDGGGVAFAFSAHIATGTRP